MSYENQLRKERIRALFKEHKTRFDKDLPEAARDEILFSLLESTLQDKNAQLILNEAGDLYLSGKDGNTIFGPDNRPWDPGNIVRHALMENKVLEETITSNQQSPSNNETISKSDTSSQPLPSGKSALSQLVSSSIKDIETAYRH